MFKYLYIAAASCETIQFFNYKNYYGEVAEWFKAHAWKVCRGESLSRVRIPLSPPLR